MALRTGIVGAGRAGSSRARQLRAYPDVEVTAVAEPNRPARDAFARAYGARLAVADHKRLVANENVDVVYICSPPATRATMAVDSLHAGKHVICEHPMAVTVEDALEVISAAEQTDRRLFVAIPQRYEPVIQEIHRLIEADEIGFPFLLTATHVEDEFDRLNDWHDWKGSWSIAGGGILMQRGSEIIDLLCYLLGEIQAVSAACTRFATEPLDKAEDTCSLCIEFTEDIGAHVLLTGAARYSAWPPEYVGAALRLEVYGLRGAILMTSSPSRLVVTAKGRKRLEIAGSEIPTDLPTDMNRDFIDSILEDRTPLVTAQDALYALRVVLTGYKSSQNKRRVELLEELHPHRRV